MRCGERYVPVILAPVAGHKGIQSGMPVGRTGSPYLFGGAVVTLNGQPSPGLCVG